MKQLAEICGQSTGATDFTRPITFPGLLSIVNPVSSIFHFLWLSSNIHVYMFFINSSEICEPLVHTFMSHFWSWSLKNISFLIWIFSACLYDKVVIPCVIRSVILKLWVFLSTNIYLQNFELSSSHQPVWAPYLIWTFQTSTRQLYFPPHEIERIRCTFPSINGHTTTSLSLHLALA